MAAAAAYRRRKEKRPREWESVRKRFSVEDKVCRGLFTDNRRDWGSIVIARFDSFLPPLRSFHLLPRFFRFFASFSSSSSSFPSFFSLYQSFPQILSIPLSRSRSLSLSLFVYACVVLRFFLWSSSRHRRISIDDRQFAGSFAVVTTYRWNSWTWCVWSLVSGVLWR